MNISSMKIMKKMYKQPETEMMVMSAGALMDDTLPLAGSPTGPGVGAPARRGASPLNN